MLGCSWAAGVPTLSLIPHTDFPSFAAAAQAFHIAHYTSNATQLASSFAPDFGRKIARGVATTVAASGDDIGEKVSRATVKVTAGAAEDIGERVSRAKVMPSAGTVEDAGQKAKRTAGNGGGIGNQISGVAPAKSNHSNISDDVSGAAAQAGSCSKAEGKGARAASDSNLEQEVSRPSSADPEKLKTTVSDSSAEGNPGALGSTLAQSVAAAASLVPKAPSSMGKLSEAKQQAGNPHDCSPRESHAMPVGLAAKPTRRQGAQAAQAEQLASPGDAALLVFEDR